MSTAVGPLFAKPRGSVLIAWTALAMLNLTAGMVISSDPQRLTDIESMLRWGQQWLAGTNVYQVPNSYVDYPPNAIVMMSPFGVLPMSVFVCWWILVNVGLACLAPYLAARFFRPHVPFRVITLPILMFLCWGGVRTLTQFSLIALTLSMAALILADRRAYSSGVVLGLGLMKPHVALPVFFWSVFTRRWRVTLTSTAVVAALIAVFCAWASSTPTSVFTGYTRALTLYHTGDAILSGLSELRPLVWQVMSDKSEVDMLAGGLAIGLLAAICVAGYQEGAGRKRLLYAAPPLLACWCLVTFRHLTYGFIVLLPVMMLLALNDAEQSPLRKALFWILQLGMMFDVPGLTRRSGFAETPLYTNVLIHADRVLVLVLFVGLVILAWREAPEPG